MSCDALAQFTRASFGHNTPSLRSYVTGFPYLEKLVDLLEPAIDETATRAIGEYGAEGLHHAIRALVSEVNNIAQASFQSPRQNERLKSVAARTVHQGNGDPAIEIFSLKSELFDLKQKNVYMESIQKATYEETATLQEEIEGLYALRNKLTKQLAHAQCAFDDALSQKTLECARLEDKAKSAEAALENAHSEIERLKRHLEIATEDEAALREELSKLRERIQKKRDTQAATERKLVEAIDVANKSSMLTIERTKSKMEIDEEKQLIDALRKEIEEQAQEIQENERDRQEERTVMENQEQKIEELKDQLALMAEKVDEGQKEKETLMSQIRRSAEEKLGIEKEAQQLRDEVNELEGRIQELMDTAGVDIADLQDWVSERARKYDPGMSDELKKLRSVVDGLSCFIEGILSHESHPLLDYRPLPIVNDPSMRARLIANINEIREMAGSWPESHEFGYFRQVFSSEGKTSEIVDKMMSTGQTGDIAALAALCAVNSCLVENFHELVAVLDRLYAMIPVEHKDKEKHDELEHFVKGAVAVLQVVNNQIRGTRWCRGKYASDWEGAKKLLDDCCEIVGSMHDELGPLLGTTVITDIPKVAKDRITEITKQVQDLDSRMEEMLHDSISQLEAERDEFKEKIERSRPEMEELLKRTIDLRKTICAKDDEIRALREKVEDMEDSRIELEKTFESFHENNNKIEEKARVIQNERDRLAQIMDERNERFARRMEEAVEQERKRAESELELVARRATEHLKLVNDKLDAKKRKLRAVSARAREMAETFDGLLQEKLATIRSLTAKLERKRSTIAFMKEKLDGKRDHELRLSPERALTPTKLHSTLRESSGLGAVDDKFAAQLGAVLSRYDGSDGLWTRSRILSAVTLMVNRLLSMEKLQEESTPPTQSPRVRKIIQENNEWRQWASDLVGGDMADCDMRTLLSEMLVSASSQSTVQKTVNSLRTQKRLLAHSDILMVKNNNSRCLAGVVLAVVFARKLLRFRNIQHRLQDPRSCRSPTRGSILSQSPSPAKRATNVKRF